MSSTMASTEPDTDSASEPSETDNGETDNGETDSGETDDPTVPGPTAQCDGERVDHADECGAACPITADVRVECDARGFGDPGLNVAPGTDATWLVTATGDHALRLRIQPDGLDRVDPLPVGLGYKPLTLALDLDGHPVVTGGTAAPNREGSVMYVTGAEAAYEVEVFAESERTGRVFATEFDAEGVPHVWFGSDPSDGRAEATRDPDGAWTLRDAPLPGTSGYEWFTLTPDGASVGFDYVGDTGSLAFAALIDGDTEVITSTEESSLERFFVAPGPTPAMDVEGPDYIGLVHEPEGARVVWSTPEGIQEVALSGTEWFAESCRDLNEDGLPGGCPDTCEETGSGVQPGMLGVARTQDGRVWAAWARTQRDQTLSLSEACDVDGCHCNRVAEREESVGEIVVVEIDLETLEVREAIRVMDTDPHTHGAFLADARPFHLRAFGTDLALGARVRLTDRLSSPAMRVLRVDTTLVP